MGWLLVYFSGYILSMVLIYITDRTVHKEYLRTSLGRSLTLSLLSYILVFGLLTTLLFNSKFMRKLDNFWRFGEHTL